MKTNRQYLLIAIITISTGFFTTTLNAEEVISRADLIKGIQSFNAKIDRGLHVQYSANVNLAVPVEKANTEGILAIGSRKPGIAPPQLWRAEHAYLNNGTKYFHLTAGSEDMKSDNDSLARKVADGKLTYIFYKDHSVLIVLQGKALKKYSKVPTPDEELYKEILGFESTKHNRVHTLRGSKNPNPYDLLTVVKDKTYKISQADKTFGKNIVLLEKLNVDRIWLDASRNFSIVRRERFWGTEKTLKAVFTNSEFKKTTDGVWLPQKSVIEYYGKPGTKFFTPDQVVVRTTLTIQHVSLTPPEKLFKPDLSDITYVVNMEQYESTIPLTEPGKKNLVKYLAEYTYPK